MTLVIVVQSLVVTLAVLVLIESCRRRLPAERTEVSVDADGFVEFHPELLVRWDDEANHARIICCTRRPTTDRSAGVRPLPVVPRSGSRIR